MRYLLYRITALVLLILCLPLLAALFILVKLDSPGPFIFRQKRTGKGKKPFVIYKIRTMIQGAEKIRAKYTDLNEADGPVFKIRHDPRYTRAGKSLAHAGLDELPQLVNIIRGEMSFVGPRPLPVYEARRISKRYDERFSVLPGVTSLWFILGAHDLSFKQWMESDVKYARKQSLIYDCFIIGKTIGTFVKIF